MKKTLLLAAITALAIQEATFAQIRWINDLEKGLQEARDRDAPIVAFLWDYN